MAKVLAIAEYHEYRGSFTNNKNVWNALEKRMGVEPTATCEPLEDLVIQDDKGKIEGTIEASQTVKQFTTATYAHMCTILRRDGKVAFHDSENFMPIFAVWIGEMNELYGVEEDEDLES